MGQQAKYQKPCSYTGIGLAQKRTALIVWRFQIDKIYIFIRANIFRIDCGAKYRYLVNKNSFINVNLVTRYIKVVQNIALLGMFPFLNAAAFWIIKLTDLKIIILPVLCVAQIVLGGLFGIAGSKILRLDRKKTGSMFVCSSFSNLSAFGGLICFVFFGEISYVFVTMYVMFEQFTQYTYGFPIAKLYGEEDKQKSWGLV